MSVSYGGVINQDAGLEWGTMWLLEPSFPSYWSDDWTQTTSVKRVIVARRKLSGHRSRAGERYRLYIRLPDRSYGSNEYHSVDEGYAASPRYPARRLFLTEADAWRAYVDRLQRHLDQMRSQIERGQTMMIEAEAILRLRESHP